VSDFQAKISMRLLVTIPVFLIALLLTRIDFAIIWRYFGWSNQVLATVVLWTIVIYIRRQGKTVWFVLIPAAFMTTVVITYILVASAGFGLEHRLSYIIGILVAGGLSMWSLASRKKDKVGAVEST